jgi:hypothetical protein
MRKIKLGLDIHNTFDDLPCSGEIVLVWYRTENDNMFPLSCEYKGSYMFYYRGTDDLVPSGFIGWSDSNIRNFVFEDEL